MDTTPRVHVRAPADRSYWMLQWKDPMTGKTKSKSSGVERRGIKGGRGDAERAAARLQAELEAGNLPTAGRLSWDAFCEEYERKHARGLARESQAKIAVVFSSVVEVLRPRQLRDISEARLSELAAKWRSEGKSENTIHSYLSTLKAALRWAVQQKMMPTCPAIPKIQRRRRSGSGSLMKGRAPTDKEFALMLESVPEVIRKSDPGEWCRYLKALWFGGLRLQESLELWWDRVDKLHPVFPENGKPLLRIVGEYEKGHTDRLLPVAPEFAELLLATPESQRKGPVFPLAGQRGVDHRLTYQRVGRLVSAIGQAADVKVHVDPEDDQTVKYASAHDLRRAFGERWAALVMPPQLQELMRHASIETTLRYYVAANAEKTASICWAAYEKAAASRNPGVLD